MYQRTGSCNRCGMCCGAEYPALPGYTPHGPWPYPWPESIRYLTLEQLAERWPQGLAFGILTKDGGIGVPGQKHGQARVTGPGGGRYYYVWIEASSIDPRYSHCGFVICKDTSAAHDGSSWSVECPFLKGNPDETDRPCGLVGTNSDSDFRLKCEHQPPMEKTAEEVAQWQNDHPFCSYEWVEV